MRAELKKDFGEMVGAFWGNQKAKIVSIGQAPSISGIKNQKPFSDKSGDKLRNSWYQISEEEFYNPDNFYFTALGMYYPGKGKKGGDKKPDLKYTRRFLKAELEFLQPKLFILVGAMAAEFFFPEKDFLTLIMSDQTMMATKTLVLPHPSPLNIKWFKDHPEFEKKRLPIVRKAIHVTLDL